MIAYVDSSVVLRLVLRQPDALPHPTAIERGVTSVLTEVECARTLDRARLRRELTDVQVADKRGDLRTVLARLETVDLTRAVLEAASRPMATTLGTLDALHLATALLWSESRAEPLTVATHDVALALAARAHGLAVLGV